jgi:hypothetical protein
MSKNLTRKGLAFGALVALGTSVVAGAPANAAPTSLAIASSFGTSTSTILGLDFNVAVTAAGLATGSDQFKLFVEGAVAGDFKAATTSSRSTTDLTTAAGTTYNTDSADITTVSATDKTSVVSGIDTVAANYTQIKLGLSSTAVTATRTIKVTPFVDNIVADGKITAGELTGAPISITYVKGSEVTATTTLAAPTIGGDSLSATVTLDKDINLQQVVASNSAVKVFFKKNGAFAKTDDATSKVEAVWSKTDAALKASLSSLGYNIASNQVYSATALVNDLASGNVSTGTATAGDTELVDSTVTSGTLTSTKGANVQVVSSSYGVRTGTASVTITSAAAKKLNDDSNQVAAAGVPAKVTVTATTLGTGSKFTAGGKTVDTQGSSISFSTTTNADGKVVFDLGATGAKLDKATVAVSVLDKTSNYIDYVSQTWTWIDATVNVEAVDVDAIGGNTPVRTVKAGGSYTLNLALSDDFGALYAGTARRAAVTISGASGVVAALAQNVTFVGGKASLVINDANSANGSYSLDYRVQSYSASTDSWTSVGSGSSTTVYVQKNVTAGFVTAAASGSPAIEYDALTAQDARLDSNSTDLTVYGSAATVAGSVLDTDGTVLEGAPVTVSGAGLLFKSGNVTALGSITVLANASGAYSVEVSSSKAGKQTVTVTSGSVSKTVTPDFGTAAASAAENITITAPATATPGSTTAVTVKLTDKFGNAVKTDGASGLTFTVRVSGVGSTGSFTEATNADGEVKFNQVIGSADSGSFVVTVKYDADGATTTKAAISKTATVTVAAPAVVVVEPVSKIGTANGRIYANVKDGKGSVVTVRIANKWFTKTALNNDYTFSFKNKKGAKVSVKVYVDGDLSASKTITVK